ncbi:cysteine proteinase [Daldinia caldariorum]|uniref:cysteine proteinase n=1 Tax=Daldinia caldariorum TaxID=326644 RepID=UPI0020081660|nr:cysteine proteinase [Daldinia caldariorum]KAI1463907.1 cysteine proteinase [Daldinia caldariorum]
MSDASSTPPSESGRLSQDAGDRTVMAVVPGTTQIPKKNNKQTPQEAIDQFWNKFTTKAPGKATTVIPHNEYAEKAAKRSAKAVGTNTQTSYEEAAALCRAKVAKIVKECRRVNQKYRDPHFDLEIDLKWGSRDTLESLCNTKEKPDSSFKPKSVKRVVDIFDDPKFYIEGPTANDVRQGRDGDCWLLAALCTLSNKPSLIEKVCVARDEQVGVYGFVFHRDGEWISEIIDDKLFLTKPDFDESFLERILWEDRERINSEEQYRKAYQSGSGALYFAQCEHENETWLPLLEKAYAKAHGDYASIDGGFTGEGIEDLTGGVTSELYTTDILDKEYFWKEELMKVNAEFLFGCSTGMWGSYWGDRKGIYELHAYSIMKAVDIDGQRLVLLKNPWGRGEWTGPWSDGSKEWTAEWLVKLNHRFGDDGNFWISYDDLLRKYQAFDRTRLFGPEWKVTSLWTTLSVPWTLDYHDTYFAFSLAKTGPVVIVLSQLDERYYLGLEGQYRFELNFRLHKTGQEDYVVRSISSIRLNRSVNVELELEEGEYTVLLKIDATRNMYKLPIEDVVRNHARDRRDKLVAVGMSYDLAHSKGKVVESPEEKKARKEAEQRKKDKEREELRKELMETRRRDHYYRVKDHKKDQKRKAKAKAKAQAKAKKAKKLKAKEAKKQEQASSKEQSSESGDKHVQVLSPSPTPAPEDSKEDLGSESKTDSKVETPSTEAEKPSADLPLTAEEQSAKTLEASQDFKPDEISTSESKTEHATEGLPDSKIAPSSAVKDAGGETISSDSTKQPEVNTRNEPEETQSKETEDEEDSSSDESDVSSLSEISERELDFILKQRASDPPAPPPAPIESLEEEDEFEKDPWNAVATVGLRIYYKVSDEDRDKDIVKLRVVRPNPYAKDKKAEDEDEDEKEKEKEPKTSKSLDIDDSSKDATLEGSEEQRKKSIMSLSPQA